MTTRTLAQIDLALTAVETALPQVNAGLQTTLRQNNLVLESEITTMQDALGVDADPRAGHGNAQRRRVDGSDPGPANAGDSPRGQVRIMPCKRYGPSSTST
jgi:hypothetical protein